MDSTDKIKDEVDVHHNRCSQISDSITNTKNKRATTTAERSKAYRARKKKETRAANDLSSIHYQHPESSTLHMQECRAQKIKEISVANVGFPFHRKCRKSDAERAKAYRARKKAKTQTEGNNQCSNSNNNEYRNLRENRTTREQIQEHRDITKMDSESRVFASDIIRVNNKLKNNLYDVINIVPAKPCSAKSVNDGNCSFVPRSDKYYVSKKKNGAKVKTVRDIRNIFEKDVYSYLPDELEKQKSLLMRKIRGGSSKEEETRQIAKNILNNDSPVTRQVWQMIMNINPLDCKFSSRYILWNGRIIQVSGSKAGKKKFITNYDIGKDKKCSLFKPINKRPLISKRKGLLHNSLNVKFRPGPLTRKKYLDTSYQKYQFGDMELVNLPKPGLDIHPTLGKTLAPTINTFLQNTFSLDSDGKISKKWADFAVSVLGTVKNGTASQISEGCGITFDLNYKCLQHRLLMRHDSDITTDFQDNVSISNVQIAEEHSTILSQVKNIMKDILNSVEISLNQDDLYFGEDEPRDNLSSKSLVPNSYSKERPKRKCTELDRLDVTVIRISDNLESSKTNKCYNAFCTLGCVCESIKCTFNLKRHCGQLECMFHCKCDFSKYKLMDSIDSDCSDIIPGLVNLDKKLGLKLAKEEQKFHQTVIMTEEKSIHLKSQRRNWKTSKKYAEFYSTMRLKAARNGTKILSIACVNLDCKDVEPWCMVHNLYKCFCKGKFTESFNHNTDEIKVSQNENDNGSPPTSKHDNDDVVQINDLTVDNDDLLNVPSQLRPRVFRSDKSIKTACTSETNYSNVIPSNFYGNSCSRINSYKGRKYDALYYQKTNQKILDMERNDKKIHKRLTDLINKDDKTKLSATSQNEQKPIDITTNITNVTNPASSLDELLTNVIENSTVEDCIVTTTKSDTTIKPNEKRLPNKTKLVAWLETSYKQYKETPEKSLMKLSLDPPKSGKVALYPWEFVLSRYRERKNYFLLTKQKPFRIFMAVDIKNSFFESCINISDIALSELDKYPITVKNLLTNASDLKDNFCILNGLSFCWELVGSVAKVHEKSEGLKKTDETKDTTKLMLPLEKSASLNTSLDQLDSDNTPTVDIDESDTENDTIEDFRSPQIEENIELSKWFVMTLETDFTEIRFYNKGFFVKYDSVIKAINVARLSGKTVRLSSQRCNTAQNDPQFGIYAIPTKEDYCVFIGPYEENERLGIETVKNTATRKKKKSTRGIWITTNKLDNLNVIDNPLLYMPSNSSELDKIVTLDSGYKAAINYDSGTSNVPNDNIEEIPVKKVVKPIKLRKSGFYHLSSQNLLKRLPVEQSETVTSNRQPIILNKPIVISKLKTPSTSACSTTKISCNSNSLQDKNNEFNKSTIINKPIAEIAPQIKETNKVQNPETRKRKFEGGMYILKPEEINKKSCENKLFLDQITQPSSENNDSDANQMDMDIERFLATSEVCTLQDNDVYVISDDEDNSFTPKEAWQNVWIVCKNIENFGWIAGRKDNKNYLSFEFPGFKFTEFYPEIQAYNKINQVLSRKVYVPKHVKLDWHFVESEADVKDLKKLDSKDLSSDLVLTNKGLRHIRLLLEKFKCLNTNPGVSNSSDECDSYEMAMNKKIRAMSALEETSTALDEETNFLWDKTILKKGEILESFSKTTEDLRKELNDKLNAIISDSKVDKN